MSDQETKQDNFVRVTPEAIESNENWHIERGYAEEDEVRLSDYWNAIHKRFWLIVAVVAGFTSVTALYMFRKANVYEATARVQIDLENNNPMLVLYKNDSFVFSNPVNDPTYFNRQLQILSSPTFLRRISRRLDLEHNATVQNQLRPSLSQRALSFVGLSRSTDKDVQVSDSDSSIMSSDDPEELSETKRLAPIIKLLAKNLTGEPIKENRLAFRDTRLIEISFADPNPKFAAKIVNTVADALMLSNLEERAKNNSAIGDFLEKRIAETEEQIQMAQERLNNYSSDQSVAISDGSRAAIEQVTSVRKELLEAESDREAAEFIYRSALNPTTKEAITVDRNATEIDKEIALLGGKNDEGTSLISSEKLIDLERGLQQAKDRAAELRQTFEQKRRELTAQKGKSFEYKIAQQEVETNRHLLGELRSKLNTLSPPALPNNIAILEYAVPPIEPTGPKRLQYVGLAFGASLLLGILLALLLEQLDDSLDSPAAVSRVMHLPTVGVIPSVRRRRKSPFTSIRSRPEPDAKDGHNSQLIRDSESEPQVIEAYNQLRTFLTRSRKGPLPKTLLITSSVPFEGATDVTVNIALSLAQTGARVVLIDANMRHPSLHAALSVDNRRGLSALAEDVNDAEILALIQRVNGQNLYVLPAGPKPNNPSELIASEQMHRVINLVTSTYTYVVIDSPPVSAFTDGVLLATMADIVLIVVRSGKTSRRIVRRSQQLLTDIGAKIFGVVLYGVAVPERAQANRYE